MEEKELIEMVKHLFKFKKTFESNQKRKCFAHLESEKSKQTIASLHREEFLDLKKKLIDKVNEIQVDK